MKRFYARKMRGGEFYQVWDRVTDKPISFALSKEEAAVVAKKFPEVITEKRQFKKPRMEKQNEG